MKPNRFAWAMVMASLLLASATTSRSQNAGGTNSAKRQFSPEEVGLVSATSAAEQDGKRRPKLKELVRFEEIKSEAEQGDSASQNTMGNIARDDRDLSEAVTWYKRAAIQGNGDAQLSLGEIYASGEGAYQDFVEAYKWLNIAATSTNAPVTDGVVFSHELTPAQREALGPIFQTTAEKAKRARSNLAKQMTPAQIAEAQRLSRSFKPRIEGEPFSSDTPTASGTGFFISDDGYLISNHHVVEGANQVRLVTSTGLISAKVVKVDAANDLALLKAEGKFSALPVAASRGVKLGGTVATVGFPNIGLQGFAPKLAKGDIASLSGAGDDARYFQISVPVQPGNSGGALVDERGNVVGVVSAKLNASAALRSSGALPENVNYAVKSSYLLSFLESVPDVANKLKEASAKEKKFEDVVKEAEQAAVLVLVY